jgi:hypothetical protein
MHADAPVRAVEEACAESRFTQMFVAGWESERNSGTWPLSPKVISRCMSRYLTLGDQSMQTAVAVSLSVSGFDGKLRMLTSALSSGAVSTSLPSNGLSP